VAPHFFALGGGRTSGPAHRTQPVATITAERLDSHLPRCAVIFHRYGNRYLATFAYRFNRRFDLRKLNERLLVAAATCGPRSRRAIRVA